MNWSEFLLLPEHFPPGYGFPLFGGFHLGWLAAISAAAAVCCWWYRRQVPSARKRFLKGFAVLIAVQEVLKDLLVLWAGCISFLPYLPLHLCGLSMFVYLFVAFRPTPFNRELTYCLCLPGALAALLFCDWTGCPPLNLMCWHNFIAHGYLVAFAVVQLAAGEIRPNWRRLPKCFLWLAVIALPIYFLNKAFDTNFLFLNVPSEGSPLVPLEKLFGNPGYIFGTALLLLAIWVIMYLPWGLADLYKNKKLAAEAAETTETTVS